MQNYDIFDEKALARIGVVCPRCKTEAVFDLSREQNAQEPRKCSGCGKDLLDVFARGTTSYTLVTWYKTMRDMEKKINGEAVEVKFYFRKP